MFRKTGAPIVLGETRSFWATASYRVYEQGEGQSSFAYDFHGTAREHRKATAAWVYETKQRKPQDMSRVGDCNHKSLLLHHKNAHSIPTFACYGSSTGATLHVVREYSCYQQLTQAGIHYKQQVVSRVSRTINMQRQNCRDRKRNVLFVVVVRKYHNTLTWHVKLPLADRQTWKTAIK